MIIISSMIDGYRRCGIEHPSRPTEYPDEQFSPAELELLQQTPVLTVQIIKDDNETKPLNTGEDGGEPEGQRFFNAVELETLTVSELKARALVLGLDIPGKITKAQIIEQLVSIPLPDSLEQ